MNRYLITGLICLSLISTSCKKFLDEKPDSKLVVPQRVEDLQALLDVPSIMNQREPLAGEGSADDYYLTDASFNGLQDEGQRNMYLWGDEFYYTNTMNDWSRQYDIVYRANLALEEIEKIGFDNTNIAGWKNVKGSGYFFRAKSFYNIARIWAKTYDSTSANSEFGIPIRLSTDFNIVSTRSSIKESYEQIIADLKKAIPLLPELPEHVLRPSKAAAYALLTRIYLTMRKYNQALLYSDSSLRIYNFLLDYNSLNPSANFPFSRFNKEVIFHSSIPTNALLINSTAKIDSGLYGSYSSNDLRKVLFFRNNNNGSFGFKGSYDGSNPLFTGISTAEMYLTRAECYARAGQITKSMDDLNTLLNKRWKAGTFVPFAVQSSNEAVDLILSERRKELLMRDLRWMDIKRLNKEGRDISIIRVINGQQYRLAPNDNRYALPIPKVVIDMTGMPQNPR